jgi:hypothetical protein
MHSDEDMFRSIDMVLAAELPRTDLEFRTDCPRFSEQRESTAR